MKSKETLKKELHKLIESIDDEKLLDELNEEIIPYLTKAQQQVAGHNSDLTREQFEEPEEGFREMESGKYATMADFKNAMGRWLTE
jgi:hypothetical protein